MRTKKIIIISMILALTGTAAIFAAQEKTIDPVNWRELAVFLTDIEGWTSDDKAEGSSVSMGSFKMSQAERTYFSNDVELQVNIIDGGFAPMAYSSFKMAMSFEIDTSEKYIKKVEIKGYPGVEQYEYEDKEGQVMILIKDRFLVTLKASEIENTDILKQAAGSLDFEGLAGLAK